MNDFDVRREKQKAGKFVMVGREFDDDTYLPLGITVVNPGIMDIEPGRHYASDTLELSAEYDSGSALEAQEDAGIYVEDAETVVVEESDLATLAKSILNDGNPEAVIHDMDPQYTPGNPDARKAAEKQRHFDYL
ncbi:MAG: hypothetical protein ABEJ69_03505 [Candidatus Nanohaloarchaea archaeon]